MTVGSFGWAEVVEGKLAVGSNGKRLPLARVNDKPCLPVWQRKLCVLAHALKTLKTTAGVSLSVVGRGPPSCMREGEQEKMKHRHARVLPQGTEKRPGVDREEAFRSGLMHLRS